MVKRLALLFLLAAAGCNVDRNLDPVIFACESGGTCDPPRDAAVPDTAAGDAPDPGTPRDTGPNRRDGGFDPFDIYIPDIYIPDIHIPDIFIPECYPFC